MGKNIAIFVLIIIIAGGGWFYFKGNSEEEYKQETANTPPATAERAFPAGFPRDGLKEKEVDLNNDGKKELLLTSKDINGGHAILVDPSDTARPLSNMFNFPQGGFAEEYAFKSEEAPEIDQIIDLNKNGKSELVFDLKNYGAYTSTYGVVIFAEGKLLWLMVEDADGSMRPAIFHEGASVRNAEAFKVLDAEKALVQVSGVGDKDGNWTWDAKAFTWDVEKYKFNSVLSAKIKSEQPKKIINGEPVF